MEYLICGRKPENPYNVYGNRRPMCLCGRHGIRDETYDAYYCPSTGTWLEQVCDDPKCEFCRKRPEKRLQMGKPMIVRCNWCLGILEEPGALLFSPPTKELQCTKLHLCKDCYARIFSGVIVPQEKTEQTGG